VARGGVVKVRALAVEDDASRAAIAVHGSKSAVVRNRARRRVRAALDPALRRHAGLHLLVSVAAADAAVVPFVQLADAVETAVAGAAERAR